jgi:hypothetical protein
MRINLNSQHAIDKVVSLCNTLDVSNPTQLIYLLIEQAYNKENAQGCKENANKENSYQE